MLPPLATLAASAGAAILLLLLLAVVGSVAGAAQSVVGAGIPGRRAGFDALLKRVKFSSNIAGANANTDITVSGITIGAVVLTVIAGDGTDLGAAEVSVTAADTIQIDTSTAAKKLTVVWIAPSSAAPSQGTEYDPVWGAIDTLLGVKLRASVVAGANGALTLTGLATADSVLGLFCTDGTIALEGSAWAVTTNTLTPTPSIDTSGKSVVVLWIDESAAAGGNGNDWNSNIGSASAGALTDMIRGLRCSSATGPAIGTAEVVADSFADIVAADNLLALWSSDSGTDPLDANAWTTKAGGLDRSGNDGLDGVTIYALWLDLSATTRSAA